MRIQGEQKYVLLAGMTGFLLGICSANLWMKQYVLDIGILNQYFLEQYNRADIVYEAYLWYLVKSRGTPFVLLLAAAGTRYRKTAVMLAAVWLGFCFGMVICTAIIKLGSKGIVLIVTALAPQGIFYAMAGIVLFRYMLEYPMVRWDAGRSIRLGLFLMLGIITECYVNPVLTGLFLKTLYIQKCRIKEPIHEKICFISCIGSFLSGKSVNICRRIQITGECSKETGISG